MTAMLDSSGKQCRLEEVDEFMAVKKKLSGRLNRSVSKPCILHCTEKDIRLSRGCDYQVGSEIAGSLKLSDVFATFYNASKKFPEEEGRS